MDQYDRAELVRKKTTTMFCFITRIDNKTPLFGGENTPNEAGQALVSLEPGSIQFLDPGENIKFSAPGNIEGHYEVFMKTTASLHRRREGDIVKWIHNFISKDNKCQSCFRDFIFKNDK